MDIQKTSAISGVSANTNRPPQDFSKLPAGAMLHAVVSGITGENCYLLKLLDGRLIRAQTLNELALGQVLKLEVVKAGAVPELKIVTLPPEHAGPPAALVVQNALRQLLPKQTELKDLTALLKQALGSTEGISRPVSAAIQSALAALPAKTDLMTAEGVKQSIANSGVFLEAKLAHQISPQGDIKGQLLVLAEALQQPPPAKANDTTVAAFQSLAEDGSSGANPALLAKTEGAIARITLDQLTSLPRNEEVQNSWQISLPFTNGQQTETVNLKIKRETSHNPAQQHTSWSVVLELKPPGMATLHCKVSLHAGKVDTYFWSDSGPNRQQVQEHLALLARRYAEAGLTAGHLNVVDAARMGTEIVEKNPLPTLLDDFA